jgi:hypothetical protein
VTTTNRAGPYIAGFLLLSLLLAAGVVLLAPAHTRGPVLAFALFTTLALIALSVFVVRWTAGFPRGPIHELQRSSPWHVLSRTQWIALTAGATAIAALTVAGTGFRMAVAAGGPEPAAVVAPTRPADPTPTYTPPTPESTPSPATPSAPSDDPGTSSSASDLPTNGPSTLPGRTTYLDTLEAVNGYFSARPINLSGKRYPRSVNFGCERPTNSFVEWSVAGSKQFAATLGIPDETSNAFGRIVEIIFYDQDGHQLAKPTDVSVGHPVPITIPLNGVVHLRMACSARDAKDGSVRSVYAALGDALIVSG